MGRSGCHPYGGKPAQEGGDGLAMIHFSALDALALPVRDVAVDAQGTAWPATDGGLFRILPQGGLVRGRVLDRTSRPVAGVDITSTRDGLSGSHRRRGLLRPRQPPTWTLYLPGRWTTRHRGPFSQVFLPDIDVSVGEHTLEPATLVPPDASIMLVPPTARNIPAGVVGQQLPIPCRRST